LLKPIEHLMKFINMVRILFTFKAGWLLHISYLIEPFKKALLTSI
jgi:hypothetical protein